MKFKFQMSHLKLEIGGRKLEGEGQKAAKRNPKSKIGNRQSQECYCYMVECADGTLYTGWTTNLRRRVAAHNAGRGSRYTRMHRPVKLVYFEHLPNRSEAMRREAQIKRMKRSAKLAQISNFKSQMLSPLKFSRALP